MATLHIQAIPRFSDHNASASYLVVIDGLKNAPNTTCHAYHYKISLPGLQGVTNAGKTKVLTGELEGDYYPKPTTHGYLTVAGKIKQEDIPTSSFLRPSEESTTVEFSGHVAEFSHPLYYKKNPGSENSPF